MTITIFNTPEAFQSYTLRRLIRRQRFSFEEGVRNGFVWKRVIFQDGEERAVPPVSRVWSFKPQHQSVKATK